MECKSGSDHGSVEEQAAHEAAAPGMGLRRRILLLGIGLVIAFGGCGIEESITPEPRLRENGAVASVHYWMPSVSSPADYLAGVLEVAGLSIAGGGILGASRLIGWTASAAGSALVVIFHRATRPYSSWHGHVLGFLAEEIETWRTARVRAGSPVNGYGTWDQKNRTWILTAAREASLLLREEPVLCSVSRPHSSFCESPIFVLPLSQVALAPENRAGFSRETLDTGIISGRYALVLEEISHNAFGLAWARAGFDLSERRPLTESEIARLSRFSLVSAEDEIDPRVGQALAQWIAASKSDMNQATWFSDAERHQNTQVRNAYLEFQGAGARGQEDSQTSWKALGTVLREALAEKRRLDHLAGQ